MKNKKLRIAAALLLLTAAVTACADAGSTTTETQNPSGETASAVTEAPVEKEDNGRSGVEDNLPDDLDLGGETIRFMVRAGDLDTSSEFIAESTNGEIVNDAVFARNQTVEERLNVKIEFNPLNVNRHGGFSGDIRKSVMAGSDDFELVANGLYDTVPLTMEGMFLDLLTLDYLDFEQPWWNRAFFEMTEFNGHNYLALGELSQTMISGTFSMFFNKTMFREFYPDDPSLYETVKAGEWTLEKMISYCTPLYRDLNGNGQADEFDRYGHFFTDTKTLAADSFTGGANISLILKNADGTYSFGGINDRAAKFYELMNTLLFENNNTCRTPDNNEDVFNTMLNGQTMFATWMLTGVNYLRDMEDDYGIIPMPKLDEAQESYTSYCHDGSSTFGIPSTENNPNTVAAFLEAMAAETYRVVTPAYFETALKGKYSRDSETSQMLDIIVEGVYLDVGYIFGNSAGHPIDRMRTVFSSSTQCEKAISTMTKGEKTYLKKMEDILEKYDALN